MNEEINVQRDETRGDQTGVLEYVNPFVGTGAHGHTYPGASAPFGSVQISPDSGMKGWDFVSGYHTTAKQIVGFSSTHLSGTGIGDLLDVSLMPFLLDTSVVDVSVGEYLVRTVTNEQKSGTGIRVMAETKLMDLIKSHFSHDEEFASPGYYSVLLSKHGIQVELTATAMTGMQTYSLPNHTLAHTNKIHVVCLDIFQSYLPSPPKGGHIELVDTYAVQGHKMTQGWASPRHTYFYIDFSEPIVDLILLGENQGIKRSGARNATSVAFLVFDTIHQLSARIGISSASVEGAKEAVKLHDGMHAWDFLSVKENTEEEWERELGKIAVVGQDENKKKTFYSALYHAMLAPVKHSDVLNNFTGPDKKVHHVDDFVYYSTLSIWDTFRAANSLHTILNPERAKEMVLTLLEHSKYSNGRLPVWALWGLETNTMPGYHAVSLLAEAWMKGLMNRTLLERAYHAMTATEKTFNGPSTTYVNHGYVSVESGPHSGTKTLEYAYDDWCIAQVAAALNLENDAIKYMNRSTFYKNIFDPTVGFMRGRHTNGSFQAPFDPKFSDHIHGVFTEGTAWQYTFFVPHDVEGLINLFNGSKNMELKLDELFFMENGETTGSGKSADISGLLGQYAHGNEPSHHISYLYNFVGSPWKTQYIVRKIMDDMYAPTPEGLIGNEDCGQMSAWFVFSALGLYPVNPADAKYHLGVPIFDNVKISVPPHSLNNYSKDVEFEIFAPGASSSQLKFVKDVRLNERLIQLNAPGKFFITYEDIMKGGTLEFILVDASSVASPWDHAQFRPKH